MSAEFMQTFLASLILGGDLAQALDEAMHDHNVSDEDAPQINSVRTFEDVGVLTQDNGLVIDLADGKKAYITIQVY